MKNKFTKLLIATLLVVAQSICFIQPASAEIVQNFRSTIPLQFFNDCTGELIEGTVDYHQIWILNAGKINSIHANVHGTFIAQTSGNQYIYQNNYKDDFTNFSCGGMATATAHARLISQGKLPNLSIDWLVTYAFDASCNELPPTIAIVGLRCK